MSAEELKDAVREYVAATYPAEQVLATICFRRGGDGELLGYMKMPDPGAVSGSGSCGGLTPPVLLPR